MAHVAYGQGWEDHPSPVSSAALVDLIAVEDLEAGAAALQKIADENGGNRVFGSTGHNATVDYLVAELEALDYYDVSTQAFVELFSGGSGSLTVDGTEYEALILTYTPNGDATGSLVAVDNLGCDEADFPPEVEGQIALISRGTCTFAAKVLNAGAAGAAAAIVYNNVEGTLAGTLGGTDPGYVPVLGLTQADGEALLALAEAGDTEVEMSVNAVLENRTTFNVIAETKGGDHDNVIALGAHTDSVEQGPGINDNGSGSIGILTVAKALTKFTTTNAVRFLWWSAEEFGLLGAEYYVSQLNQSESEIAKIRAYLNFDMIASPNYGIFIYDGDGSGFNITGPPGSSEIEAGFEAFFTAAGSPYLPTAFDGRSDYGPFLENGIAAGGLFTGAEDIKSEEEAALFGGEVDVAFDVNYHAAGDTIDNLNYDAFLLNTQAIADSVATYATSLDAIPVRSAPERRRAAAAARAMMSKRSVKRHAHTHSAPCGQSKTEL
ncbi:putative leucine aminopeptidase 2 [Cyphellophora attinorum]|uniref:Peptide hydrolase n=1 Tax=Cyphellophora attinorum TaxID=1664694 RepID=A0A0N1H0E5_9EURO|nr:putative leucine aminopeptidase 2 [Phialophora attinorum]KPI37306.1 putative leucine aminopeptidase 2 [Phialophora attinorum]